MIEKDKLYSIWVYLQAEPLFWLTLDHWFLFNRRLFL